MFRKLRERLFFWRKLGNPSERLSIEELRSIKREADYLTIAVNSAPGQPKAEDMERLKALTRTLEDATRRLGSG